MTFFLLEIPFIVGLVLVFSGLVRLSVRKKTGEWKQGLGTAVARGIVGGMSLLVLSGLASAGRHEGPGVFLLFILLGVGLVPGFGRVVQRCVRNKAGKWKEGGASLLAGVIITGVSVVGSVSSSDTIEWLGWLPWLSLPGLVLAFKGGVQLSVRKKTGAWAEGAASLLAGAIIAGGAVLFGKVLNMWVGVEGWFFILLNCLVAVLVVAVNGVADLR